MTIENDISFELYEKDFYEGGIELDIDNLIIDGNKKTIDGGKLSRIFIITGKNILLKNITFKHGKSFNNPFNSLNNHGGALKINPNASLTLKDCTFIENISGHKVNGGAVHNSGELTIKNCDFSNNKANGGGVIYNRNLLEIFNCDVNHNEVGNKGGIISNEGELHISNTTISYNKSWGGASAILGKTGGKIILNDSTLLRNKSNEGGAIVNKSNLNISNCNISSNEAFGGAGIYNKGKLNITNTKFLNNKTQSSAGGAIYNFGQLNITDSHLENNTTKNTGGAIFNAKGEISISNSIFSKNTARYDGGAIYLKKHTEKFESEKCTFRDNVPDDVYEEK